jgi:hypothetical protein
LAGRCAEATVAGTVSADVVVKRVIDVIQLGILIRVKIFTREGWIERTTYHPLPSNYLNSIHTNL